MKIAIFVNLTKKNAELYTKQIIERIVSLRAAVILPEDLKPVFPGLPVVFVKREHLFLECDAVIAVGGDGTIIRCAKEAAQWGKPVLGINVGRLGFVAGLETDELDRLSDLVDGHYRIEERMMLEIALEKNGHITDLQYALNDAVVARGTLSRILDLRVLLNDANVCDYRADGLIISTPTGSTAYSLSAGGPVIDPGMRCILLSPICPHSLFTRPVVFGEDSHLRVMVLPDSDPQKSYLTLDGNISIPMDSGGGCISIRKAAIPARLIKIKNLSFYEVVNIKLAERRS